MKGVFFVPATPFLKHAGYEPLGFWWSLVRRIGCDSLGCSTTNGLTPPPFLKNGSYIVDDFYYTNSKL